VFRPCGPTHKFITDNRYLNVIINITISYSALANLPGLELEGCQVKVEPAMERRNRSSIRPRHVTYGAPGATPAIGNRQTEFPLRILVHSDMVGAIIGRGGSTIRQITQQTRAR